MIVMLMLVARPVAAEETRTERYATTIAVLDGAALGLVVPGVILIAGDHRALGIVATSVGGALYVFGAPITHYVKQRTKDKYYGSTFLRFGVPGLLGGIGAKLGETKCTEEDKTCDELLIGLAVGAGIGVLAASTIDIALLAKRQVAVVPTNGGAMLGISGRF